MQISRSKAPVIARLALGTLFLVFGLNGFFQFIPQPAQPPPPGALAFAGALFQTGYMFPLIKGTEVFAAALLLSGRYVPFALTLLLMWCPTEATMGPIQKIFYLHLPVAISTFLACLVCFIGSIAYVAKRDLVWDRLASAAARVAVVLCSIVLITGMIWGLIVSGVAVTAMLALSGEDVDTTTLIIIGLSVLGGWLLISALLAIRPRKRQPDAVVTTAETEPEVVVTEQVAASEASDGPKA
jgi:ABC-type transport system involved in cytochrome c biogenesis permease subunit